MATARFDMKLDEKIKAKAVKASALLRVSLTDYVASLMDENATQVIAQHESITVKNDIFDRFMDACSQAREPNQALRDAVAFTQENGIK